MSETIANKQAYFRASDLDKIITEFFGNSSNCGDVINFIKENPELLLKTVQKKYLGIEAGSTAFHILAKKNFDTTISSAYKYKVGFLRDIFSDVQKVIQCLYDNIDNDELVNTIRNMNIMGKLAGGKTALDIAESDPPNIYLSEFIRKIESTAVKSISKPIATLIEEPIITVTGEPIKDSKSVSKEATNKTLTGVPSKKTSRPSSTKKRKIRTNVLTFRIDKRIITNIKEDENKIVIKTVSPYQSSNKGYKITRIMRTRKSTSRK